MSIFQALAGLASAFVDLVRSQDVPKPPPKPAPDWVPPPRPDPEDVPHTMLDAHNGFRAANRAAALTISYPLNAAAQRHAEWMAANRSPVHVEAPGTPKFDAVNFSERAKNEGYLMSAGAENAAAGQADVAEVMVAWMASPGHRANILNPTYWNIGVGVAADQYGHLYWCVVFGTPMTRAQISKLRLEPVGVPVSLPEAVVKR